MDRLLNCFSCKKSQQKPSRETDKLTSGQKACYGVGHILNDLAANAWFSYLIIYLTKVAGLSNSHTGKVVMAGQLTDGICTPITAILNDKTVCRYGRRKIWHLLGSIFVSFSFPLLFTRLLGDEASDSLKLAYYISIAAVFQFGWGCVQISHLSLIPEIAIKESEKVELNAIRWEYIFLIIIQGDSEFRFISKDVYLAQYSTRVYLNNVRAPTLACVMTNLIGHN